MIPPTLPLSYPYKPKPWLMGVVAVFFALCAVALFHSALTNTQGLRALGGITFGPQGASGVYGVLAVFSVLFVIAGLAGLRRGLRSGDMLTLTSTAVICPKPGLRPRLITVPLTTITQLQRGASHGQVFLHIHHTGGKLSIARQLFANDDAFEGFAQAITDLLAGKIAPTPD